MNRLTKKEEQIMLIIWKLDRAMVKDIIGELPAPAPHVNTVSSMVRLLEEKGFLSHKAYGNTYEYYPIISKEEYRNQFMNLVVRDYFSNSYKSVISSFAKSENISIEELKEIITAIENEGDE